jgi:hypothetical protein
MNFSQGQIYFALFFIVVFIVGIGYAYFKDRYVIKKYYQKMPLYILLGMATIVGFYIVLTKLL